MSKTDREPERPQGSWRPKSREQLSKWKRVEMEATTLQTQVMDPFSMIPSGGPRGGSRPRRRRRAKRAGGEGHNRQRTPDSATAGEAAATVLNGFVLLDAAHVSFPDDATRADVSGRDLASVNADDMVFFSSLKFLDAGENSLSLHSLAPLASLTELRLHCNTISGLGPLDGAFPALRTLDLSFNAVAPSAVLALAALPSLRELDLTGNNLADLPEDMTPFSALEEIALDSNQLEGDAPLRALATAPALRRLSLSRNYLRGVPPSVAAAHARGGFPRLERLDLSENYVAMEADLLGLALLPRLALVDVHDNPVIDHAVLRARAAGRLSDVLGPPGSRPEQPAGPVPGLTGAAAAAEEAAAAVAAAQGGGMAAILAARGRLATGAVAVKHPDPIAAVLLPDLSATVAEAAVGAGRRPADIICLPAAGTTVPEAERRRQRNSAAYGRLAVARVADAPLPLASEWREAGNARLAHTHPTVFGRPTQQETPGDDQAQGRKGKGRPAEKARAAQAGLTAGGMFLTGGGADLGDGDGAGDGDDDAESVSSAQAAEEMLAAAIAAKRSGPAPPPNPAKLRAAVNALRLALKQPLTKTTGEMRPAAHQRSTVAQLARQRPRVPYAPKRLTERVAAARHQRAGAAMANVQRVLDAMGNRYAEETGAPTSDVSPFALGSPDGAFRYDDDGAGPYGGARAESALDNEESMASLVDMVNQVMKEYDVDDEADGGGPGAGQGQGGIG